MHHTQVSHRVSGGYARRPLHGGFAVTAVTPPSGGRTPPPDQAARAAGHSVGRRIAAPDTGHHTRDRRAEGNGANDGARRRKTPMDEEKGTVAGSKLPAAPSA